MHLLHSAKFFTSVATLSQLPQSSRPEICFVGRSNSGKSTAINLFTNQKNLAFSSKNPGRTSLINFFILSQVRNPNHSSGFLVDLPGYGYASSSYKERKEWSKTLSGYLRNRSTLAGIILLIDIRRGLTKLDRCFLDFISSINTHIRILVLLTKSDKLPYQKRSSSLSAIDRELSEYCIYDVILFSAISRAGLQESSQFIEKRILEGKHVY